MIKILTIIALSISITSRGQEAKGSDHKKIDGLAIASSVTRKDLVGTFCISNGLGGYAFHLDSNMTFEKTDFSCMARFRVDSGSWTIKDSNTVILKSNKHTLRFRLVKFDNIYFFLLPGQKTKFIKDLQAAQNKFRNTRSYVIDNTTYTANYFIGASLFEKYYGREIEEVSSP